MNKRETGAAYENIAKDYLINNGYTILEMNHRNKCGEIDIIAEIGDCLVFCEVKYRSSLKYGDPLEAVDFRKQRKIYKAAMYYCTVNNIYFNRNIRFDVIGIYKNTEIQHIVNAFEG